MKVRTNKIRRIIISLIVLMLSNVCVYGVSGLWFSTDSVADSDITVCPAIPVTGQEAKILLRIHNKGKTVSSEADLECYCDNTMIGKTKIGKIESGKELVLSFPWKPTHNGMYKIKGVICGKDKMEASYDAPVVAKKLYLGWCDGSFGNSGKRLVGYLRWMNLLTQVDNPKEFSYWKRRGVTILMDRSATLKILKDAGAVGWWAQAYHHKFYKGLAINEFNMDYFGDEDKQIFKYVDEFKKWKCKHPDYFIAVWHSGPLLEEFCRRYRGFANLLMLETYTNYIRGRLKARCDYRYIDQRIDMARQMDWLDKTIMAPCVTVAYGGVTPDDIESQIRHIRQRGPEMPGLIYYCGRCTPPPLKRFADKLLLKYFIKPVITFWPENDLRLSTYRITLGKSVEIITTLYNIGGIDSGKVKVNIYAERISDGKRTKIRTLEANTLIAGDVRLDVYPAKDIEPYVQFHGLRKKGSEFTNPVIPAKTVLKTSWQPKQRGTYKIEVEIVPDKDECLNSTGSKILHVIG